MNKLPVFFAAKREDESGNMFIFFLMTILLMLAFVGLAIDMAGTVHSRQTIQNTLTSATVAAATQTNTNGTINPVRAREVAIDMYSKNRENVSMTRCATSQDRTNAGGGTFIGPGDCRTVMTHFSVVQNGRLGQPEVNMSVYECSPNFFIHMLMEDVCYEVSSTGRLASSIERN